MNERDEKNMRIKKIITIMITLMVVLKKIF
jgi:hypothetical protein